jgi:hypothetical protein
VAIFRCDPRSDASFNNVAAQYWVDVDGRMHTIERRIQHQKLAFAGLPNPSYVLEPVRKTSLLPHASVQYLIKSRRLDQLATPNSTDVPDSLEFVQLSRLCVAMSPDQSFLGLPTDVNYIREYMAWASDYLKRHLLVSEWVDPDVVRDMNLTDMRDALSILLERPPLKEIRTDPPEGIDSDLFPPLAWRWSWEYANTCLEQYEAGREAELDSDWEEAGSGMAPDSEGEE